MEHRAGRLFVFALCKDSRFRKHYVRGKFEPCDSDTYAPNTVSDMKSVVFCPPGQKLFTKRGFGPTAHFARSADESGEGAREAFECKDRAHPAQRAHDRHRRRAI